MSSISTSQRFKLKKRARLGVFNLNWDTIVFRKMVSWQ